MKNKSYTCKKCNGKNRNCDRCNGTGIDPVIQRKETDSWSRGDDYWCVFFVKERWNIIFFIKAGSV